MAAVDVVMNYLAAFGGNDPDAIAGHVADSFRNEHLSELGSGCIGRAEYRRRLPHFLAEFTDRNYSIDDVVEQTREGVTDVVVRYRLVATYDGHRIEIPGVMWFTVAEGLLTRRVDAWDSLTFLHQTGRE